MEKIGLSAKDLIKIGVSTHLEAFAESFDEDLRYKLLNLFGSDEAANEIQSKEALIRAVAAMIQENNNALLRDLKRLGVFLNRELS